MTEPDFSPERTTVSSGMEKSGCEASERSERRVRRRRPENFIKTF